MGGAVAFVTVAHFAKVYRVIRGDFFIEKIAVRGDVICNGDTSPQNTVCDSCAVIRGVN